MTVLAKDSAPANAGRHTAVSQCVTRTTSECRYTYGDCLLDRIDPFQRPDIAPVASFKRHDDVSDICSRTARPNRPYGLASVSMISR